jgi:hypothetical protein
MSHQDKRWVIVFLIYADFRTDNAFSMNASAVAEINAMLEDIMTCHLNNRARVKVVMDSIRYVSEGPGHFVVDERVLVYEIKVATGYPVNAFGDVDIVEHRTTSPCPPVDLGHALQRVEKLTKTLTQYVPVKEDEEVFLVTWDHGSAFGMFRQTDPQLGDPSARIDLTDELEGYPYLKLFYDKAMEDDRFSGLMELKKAQQRALDIQAGHNLYHLLPDENLDVGLTGILRQEANMRHFKIVREAEGDGDYLVAKPEAGVEGFGFSRLVVGRPQVPELLKNKELAQVIRNWLAGREDKKLGVVLMMNCWMMNLHTLYSLRDCVKYLVAPESNIDTPGYNYGGILATILDSRPLPLLPEQLATNCVIFSHDHALVKRAARLNPDFPKTIDYRSIFAVQLDYPGRPSPFETMIDELTTIVDEFVNFLNPITSPNKSTVTSCLLKFVRGLTFEFTGGKVFLVDIATFSQSLTVATDHVFDGLLGNLKNQLRIFFDHAARLGPASKSPALACHWVGPQWPTITNPPPKAVKNEDHWKLTGTHPTGFGLFFPTKLMTTGTPDTNNLLDNIQDDELLNGPLKNWKTVIFQLFSIILG